MRGGRAAAGRRRELSERAETSFFQVFVFVHTGLAIASGGAGLEEKKRDGKMRALASRSFRLYSLTS
jgi:hypothetical protein